MVALSDVECWRLDKAAFRELLSRRPEIAEEVAAALAAREAELEEVRDDFGRDDLFVVIVEGDVFSMDYLERLKGLHDELAEINVELESLGRRKSVGGVSAEERRAKRARDKAAAAARAASTCALPSRSDTPIEAKRMSGVIPGTKRSSAMIRPPFLWKAITLSQTDCVRTSQSGMMVM